MTLLTRGALISAIAEAARAEAALDEAGRGDVEPESEVQADRSARDRVIQILRRIQPREAVVADIGSHIVALAHECDGLIICPSDLVHRAKGGES